MIFGDEFRICRKASSFDRNVQSTIFTEKPWFLRCDPMYPSPRGGNLKGDLSLDGRKYGYTRTTSAENIPSDFDEVFY